MAAGADPTVARAIEFAARAHARQLRKDGRTPYIVHPVAVLRRLYSLFDATDRDLACAAVLHDVVEDTGTTEEELRRRFGAPVAEIVGALTIPPELHGPKVPIEAKTRRLLEDVERIPWGAIAVKLCDRWDNLGDLPRSRWTADQRGGYVGQTEEFLRAVERRLAREPPPDPMAEAIRKGVEGLATAAAAARSPAP